MKKLVIFIHGLGGSPKGTWQKFPELISKEEDLQHYDIQFYGYPTSFCGLRYWFNKCPRISLLAQGLKTFINNKCSEYDDIVLVCHSMGGLIAKQYIIDCIKYKYKLKVKKILLYATPNLGSGVANLTKLFINPLLRNQAKQLCCESEFVQAFNTDWSKLDTNCVRVKYVVGGQDFVVPYLSGTAGGQDSETVPNKDHFSLVKPKNNDDLSFLICREFLLSSLLPSKKQYNIKASYIPRKLSPARWDKETALWRESKTSLELLEKHQRIVILSDAGCGKSEELKHIAYLHSSESSKLFPFYIKLNRYTGGEILKILPPEFTSVPEKHRLLLFDGLDEVESIHYNDIRKELEKLSELTPSSHIVVSCRKNFYTVETKENTGELLGFHAFMLNDLSRQDYNNYVKRILGEKTSSNFINEIRKYDLVDYLYIPFYLVNLVNIFQKESLPKNKVNVLKAFIKSRLNWDIEHFRLSSGDDLRTRRKDIINFLSVLALGMEMQGKNFINRDNVSIWESDVEIPKLLAMSSLISMNKIGIENETWQFEHNNFQEYLTAKKLSTLPLNDILEFIYDKRFNKVLPSWGNTVNFLVSLRDNQDLLNFILEKEPEMLIKSERGKLSKEQRIEVFKGIFNKYKDKQIWIDDNYFRHEDLASFGQCDEIVIFLLSQNVPETPYTALVEAIRLLGNMEISEKNKKAVVTMLKERALDNNQEDYIQYNALLALSEQKQFHNSKLIDEILMGLKSSSNCWIKKGLYSLLINSGSIGQYIDVILDGIMSYSENHRSSRTTDLGESFLIEEALNEVEDKSIIKVADFIRKKYSQFNSVILDIDNYLDKLIIKAIDFFPQDDSVFKSMLELMLDIHIDSKKIATFFFQTHTNQRAIYELQNCTDNWQATNCIAALSDEATLDKICSSYSAGVLKDCFIKDLLVGLKNNNKEEIHQYFYKKINQMSNDKFINDLDVDYNYNQTTAKLKKQKDFDLLFDKELFLDEVKKIYKSKNTEELSYIDCENLLYREKNDFSPKVVKLLEKLAIRAREEDVMGAPSDSIIRQNNAIAYFKGLDWNYFSFVEIYNMVSHDFDKIKISQEQNDYINRQYDYYLNQVDFKLAIGYKKDGIFTYDQTSIIINYYLRKFKFQTPKHILIDMILFDHLGYLDFDRGIEYLEDFISSSELKSEVVKNLTTKKLNPIVFKNHIDYCQNKNIKIDIEIITNRLENFNSYEPMRESCLEYLCQFADDWVSILEKLLLECKDDFKWKLIEKLVPENSSECKSFLEKIMKETDKEDDKLRAIDYSLDMKNIEALKIFTQYLYCNDNIPSEFRYRSYKLQIYTLEALPFYLKLLKLYYSHDSGDHYYLGFGNSIFQALENLALTNECFFNKTIEELEKFMVVNADLKNINFINYYIDKIKKQYLIANTPQLTCYQVKNKIDKIFAQR